MADGSGIPLVFDNSNPQKTKAGFAGEDSPRLVFPSIVARQRIHAVCNPPPAKDIWVGDEVLLSQNPLLTIRHPMGEDGSITNPDDMEQLWHHAYKSLSVESESQPLLVVDRCLFAPPKTRETMTQIAFETFSVPAFYAAHADGLEVSCRPDEAGGTGLSYHSGEGYSSAVPVVGGVVLGHAAVRVVLGDTVVEEAYALPDGNTIDLGREAVGAADDRGPEKLDIHGAVAMAVGKCDRHVRRDVVGSVVFSGRNTQLPGFELGFQQELRRRFPDWDICVRPRVDPNHSAWVAGSILASLSTFGAMTITYAEYDEMGPTMVHRKCF
ncbi:actin family [Podospora conica]|nr:actin family [Schizothecium conicum]